VIRLRCRTPNEGRVRFITTEFKQKLRELGRVPGKGFYINRIWLTWGEELAPVAAGPGERPTQPGRSSRRPGRGRRGRAGAPSPSAPGAERSVGLIYDAVTDELMNRDYKFDMVFDVVLEDLPEPAIEEETAEDER